MRQPDVLIIGGGIIGLTSAWFLAREGITIAVLDQSDLGQEASWAGAGILPPGNSATACTAFDQLRAYSVEMFPELSAELRERTGIDNGYLRCGGLEFLHPEEATSEQEWHGAGIRVETLDETAARRLEPALATGLGTVHHLPDLAQVRNPRHLKALIALCQGLGVQLQPHCAVKALERDGARITAVQTPSGRLSAGQFVLATGAWSSELLAPLGWRPGIKPIRGQIALLDPGRPLLQRVLLWGPRYLVPRLEGRVLVGSTEEDVGFERRTTARAIADLIGLASTLVPALAQAHVERCWAGLRPGSPDGLPYIGRLPGTTNLIVAAGHFRAGVQTSAGTALLVTDLVLGRTPALPLEAFRLERAERLE